MRKYLIGFLLFAATVVSLRAFAADTPPADVTLVDLTSPSTTCEYQASVTPNIFKPFNDSTSLTDSANCVLVKATAVTVICDFGEGNEKAVNAYKVYMFSNGSNNRKPMDCPSSRLMCFRPMPRRHCGMSFRI